MRVNVNTPRLNFLLNIGVWHDCEGWLEWHIVDWFTDKYFQSL